MVEHIIGVLVLAALISVIQVNSRQGSARDELRAQTKLLTELLAELRLHSNAKIQCPRCGKELRLGDGRGRCAACNQEVHA